VEIANGVTESVKALGPLDLEAFQMELKASEMTAGGETVRWLVGKEVKITSKGDVYGRKWTVEKYESLLDNILEREYHKNLIFLAIKEGCVSVREISEKTGLDLKRISYLLADLEKTGQVTFTGMKDSKPVFAAL
jgi:predicted transcriptional regulator